MRQEEFVRIGIYVVTEENCPYLENYKNSFEPSRNNYPGSLFRRSPYSTSTPPKIPKWVLTYASETYRGGWSVV